MFRLIAIDRLTSTPITLQKCDDIEPLLRIMSNIHNGEYIEKLEIYEYDLLVAEKRLDKPEKDNGFQKIRRR